MSTEASLVLYSDAFFISPYVCSVFVTLREKGLDFDLRPVALHEGEQRQPAYRDAALTGKVPALRHRDFWLSESSAIVEYLDDTFPAPDFPRALPAKPTDRARARQIMAWIRSDLMPIREERSAETIFYPQDVPPLSPAGEAAARRLLHVANLVVPEGKTSLFGAWSAADTDLTFMLQRLIRNGYEVTGKVRAFADAQWARPAMQDFVRKERAPFVPY